MLSVFASALVLGLSAAIPIGPVNLEIMRRGLQGGFRAAFAVGLGAATIDGLYSVAFTLGFASVGDPEVLRMLGYAGAAVLVTLGLLTIRSAFHPAPPPRTLGNCILDPQTGEACPIDAALATGTAEAPAVLMAKGYATGLTMTATNPMTLGFWASVGAGAQQLVTAGAAARLVLTAGVIVGAMSWVVAFSLFLHHGRHWVSPGMQRALTIAGGVGIVAFGVKLAL
jgi:threonine/homoserine/homoserine lactone efflux protein